MPMYYFHLYDNETRKDDEGTDFIDLAAARVHAAGVARELTFKSQGIITQGWSHWTMRVHDQEGTELFSLALSDFENGNSFR
jgi:hypothetical protein